MWKRWGLATRMTVAVILLLIPLLVAVVTSNIRHSDERRAEELQAAALVGDGVVNILDGFLRDLEGTTLATSLAIGSQARPVEQSTNGPQLAALLEHYRELRAFFITDPQGIVIVSGLGTGEGVDVSDRPYLLELKAGAEKVWSGTLSGIESGEITIAHGRPIYDDRGAVRGYLITAFHPQVLMDSLRLSLPGDARLVLTDHRGLLMYDSSRPALDPAERDASGVPEVAAALLGIRTTVERGEVFTPQGDPSYGAVYPVHRTGWTFAYLRPLGPLDASLNARLASEVLGVTIIILLAAVFAALVANRLTQPIRMMARSAAAIAAGQRHAIPPVEDSDVEVAHLARAMGVMADAVASREDQLRFLAEASAVLNTSLDYDETLRSVAALAVPAIADWCFVDVLEAGRMRRIDVVQREPEKEHVARAFAERYVPEPADARSIIGAVVTRAEPLLMPEVDEETIARSAPGPELRELYGQMAPRSAMVVPLRARARVLGAISLVATPVSGRRFGPADLALAEELAHRAGSAVENALLYREVETALRTRDEFLAAAAHDLKTPLASVKALAQLLQRPTALGDTARVSDGLGRIDAAATRMAQSIDELLDLTRLRLDRNLDLDRTRVDLVELAREAVEEYEGLSERHRFRLDRGTRAAVGQWDRARLDRVVRNLLANAVKFSPEGGEVSVAISVDGGAASLTVRDEGVGIPPQDQPRIFERFGRGSNVIGRIPGTGIGLALVRQVVEQHGGTVSVVSTPGQGSAFTIRLPLRPATVGEPAAR